MAPTTEQNPPPDLGNRVQGALDAFWTGDTTPLERLLDSHDDSSGPGVGELLKATVGEQSGPAPDLISESQARGYEIIRELGRGGMGVVYQARQVSTKRIVALKVMLAGPFASECTQQRFQREMELAARLQHPGIVKILEGGQLSSGQRYFAMDYVEGVALDSYISAHQPDVTTILGLFMRLCEAVEHAHQRRVIHRDLKPGNVLIDNEGEPHVLDFGLAKAMDQTDVEKALSTVASFPGQVLGTLRYLSPEQAAGTLEDIDARTDVYALGVLLFEALTGSPPFDTHGQPAEVIRCIVEAPPKRPSVLSDRVDEELETIILKALEKERDHRYQSAREMGEDLRRYLSSEPILARRPSAAYALRKKLVKHRVGLCLAAAGIVLLVAALSGSLWWKQRRLDEARQTALNWRALLEAEGPALSYRLDAATALREQYPETPEIEVLWAQSLYRTACLTGKDGELEGAVSTIRQRLIDYPAQVGLRLFLISLYRAKGDFQVVNELRAQLDYGDLTAAEIAYLTSFAALDVDTCIRWAERAVKYDEDHKWAWRLLAPVYLRTDDYENALQTVRRLVDLGWDPSWCVLFEGRILIVQGRYREGIDRCTRALTFDPGSATAYHCRGAAWLCLKRYEKAIEDYSEAVKLDRPQSPWRHYQRATPLWIVGRLEEAAKEYVEVRQLRGHPSYGDARLFLIELDRACLRSSQGYLEDAAEIVENATNALKADCDTLASGDWLEKIFKCLAGDRSPDDLVAAAEPENQKELCEAYYYAGEFCLLKGRIDEARKLFGECVDTGLAFDPESEYLDPMNEYHLALWRLDQLAEEDAVTSPENGG